MPLPDEPPLQDAGNVQGGILQGYPDFDHGCLLLLQFASPARPGNVPESAARLTSEADELGQGEVATNIAFTVEGLRVAGLSDDEVRELPEEFVQGMERRAGLLGDLRINHPRRWRLPALNWDDGVNAPDIGEDDPAPRIDLSAVHAVVQVRLRAPAPASDTTPRAQLMAAMEALVAVDPDVKPLSLQWMQRQRNRDGRFEEHFGFVDSNSDPVLKQKPGGHSLLQSNPSRRTPVRLSKSCRQDEPLQRRAASGQGAAPGRKLSGDTQAAAGRRGARSGPRVRQ